MLKTAIERRYPSRRAFIAVADKDRTGDGGAGYLSRVISGKCPAPLHRIDAWADALQLDGVERERFIAYAAITHLPKMVQPRFIELFDNYGKLVADFESLKFEKLRRAAEPRKPYVT